MIIQVVTYPQKKLFEGKVDSSKTVDDIISEIGALHKNFSVDDRKLIVDRNQNLHRIAKDDAINRYYNGQLGEIYRITDGSAVRYRLVSPPVPMPKDKDKAKEKRATAHVYASAYENVLTMLQDRGCNPADLSTFAIPRDQLITHFQSGTISNLTIPGLEPDDVQLINSRGRAVYVFFLSPEDDIITSRRGAQYRLSLITMMNEVVRHNNSVGGTPMPEFDVDDLSNSDTVALFADKFELIIVYNNPMSKSEYDPGIRPKFQQAYPVQNLSFVVTRHVDQPQFVLLDPNKDQQEIRYMYAQNGRMLEGGKSLDSYSLRDGVRLMLI